MVLWVSAPVLCDPLAAWLPLQPSEAVQLVALVELQLKAEAVPLDTVCGAAVSVTLGVTVTVTRAALLVPPGPLHVSEYVALVESPAVACVPAVLKTPLQSPEATHADAFDELHDSIDRDWLLTVVGEALSMAVGC